MSGILCACPDCDLLQRLVAPPRGGLTRCCRCAAVLYRDRPDGLNRALAFTLGALVLFVLANAFPIVGLQAQGELTQTSLLGAVRALRADERPLVAALVFATTFLMPLLELVAMTYLLTPLAFGRAPRGPAPVFRILLTVRSWGMVEVFILGVLVALVKLHGIAAVVPGIALWSLGGVMVLVAAAAGSFERRAFWARLGHVS